MASTGTNPRRKPHLRLVDESTTRAPIMNLAFDGTDDPDHVVEAALATDDEMLAVTGMHMAMSGFSLSSTHEIEKDPRFSLTIGLARTAGHPDLLVAGMRDHWALAQHLGDCVRRDGELTSEVLAAEQVTIHEIHPSWHDSEYVEDWIEFFGRAPAPRELVQVVPGELDRDDFGSPPDLSRPRPG